MSSQRNVPQLEDEVTSSRKNGTGSAKFDKRDVAVAESSKVPRVENVVTSSHENGTGCVAFNKMNHLSHFPACVAFNKMNHLSHFPAPFGPFHCVVSTIHEQAKR